MAQRGKGGRGGHQHSVFCKLNKKIKEAEKKPKQKVLQVIRSLAHEVTASALMVRREPAASSGSLHHLRPPP